MPRSTSVKAYATRPTASLPNSVSLNPSNLLAAFTKLTRSIRDSSKTAGHTPVGEWAKEGRTRIAHALMRNASSERPDVLMYCLGALELFETMTDEEIQALGREIAILGMRGLDINDPSQKYTFNSLPGDFSGMHLVSLMYTAFQRVAPGTDVGIDLSREYAQAVALLEAR